MGCIDSPTGGPSPGNVRTPLGAVVVAIHQLICYFAFFSRSVDVFLQYQHLFRLQLNPSRLRAAAERSDGDADALHPALLNSICLLVCNIGDSDMKPFEDLFLSRTCETSLDSFRYTDKLDDPVAAFTIQIVSMIRTDDVLWAFDLSTGKCRCRRQRLPKLTESATF